LKVLSFDALAVVTELTTFPAADIIAIATGATGMKSSDFYRQKDPFPRAAKETHKEKIL
jgi:hypothetical protein